MSLFNDKHTIYGTVVDLVTQREYKAVFGSVEIGKTYSVPYEKNDLNGIDPRYVVKNYPYNFVQFLDTNTKNFFRKNPHPIMFKTADSVFDNKDHVLLQFTGKYVPYCHVIGYHSVKPISPLEASEAIQRSLDI